MGSEDANSVLAEATVYCDRIHCLGMRSGRHRTQRQFARREERGHIGGGCFPWRRHRFNDKSKRWQFDWRLFGNASVSSDRLHPLCNRVPIAHAFPLHHPRPILAYARGGAGSWDGGFRVGRSF